MICDLLDADGRILGILPSIVRSIQQVYLFIFELHGSVQQVRNVRGRVRPAALPANQVTEALFQSKSTSNCALALGDVSDD